MVDTSAIFKQSNAVISTIVANGRKEYDSQIAASKNAQQMGDQLQQQADVSNQNAAENAQKASQIGDIMATTGSSGSLYQQVLEGQNQKFGYNPDDVAQIQQQEAQVQGREQTALNQIQNVQGGTRGLSGAGVQAKVQSIQNDTNKSMSTLGNLMLTEQQKENIAQVNASNESNAEYKQESQAQQAYTDAAATYTSEASTYAAMAKNEFNAATMYDKIAQVTLLSTEVAMLDVANIAIQKVGAAIKQALISENYSLAATRNMIASLDRSQTIMQNQENEYNQEQATQGIAQQKQYMQNYQMMVKAGVSGGTLKKVFAGTGLSVS